MRLYSIPEETQEDLEIAEVCINVQFLIELSWRKKLFGSLTRSENYMYWVVCLFTIPEA